MDRETFIRYTQRTDFTEADLPTWFATMRDVLQTAYVTAETPWQQSGKSGTYEDWVRLRLPLAELVTADGTFLDIGCANGFLLACLLTWTAQKGVHITPHGLDIGPELVKMARERLPTHAANLYIGNGWYWNPPHRFDYVRADLEHLPRPFWRAYAQRLLDQTVTDGGLLIIPHYRSRQEDLTTGWRDEQIAGWRFDLHAITRGFNGHGQEQTRYIAIRKPSA